MTDSVRIFKHVTKSGTRVYHVEHNGTRTDKRTSATRDYEWGIIGADTDDGRPVIYSMSGDLENASKRVAELRRYQAKDFRIVRVEDPEAAAAAERSTARLWEVTDRHGSREVFKATEAPEVLRLARRAGMDPIRASIVY